MPKIDWKPEYETGVFSIDEQHQHLVELINKLRNAKEENKVPEVLREIILEIVAYTKIHFSDEEAHMKRNNYPHLDEHKQQHQILIKQIIEILEKFKSGQSDVTENVLQILTNWLIKHILRHDLQYGEYLKS